MSSLIISGGTADGAGTMPFLLDPILSDGDGSLMLIDVANWDAGVPAHNAALRNIAYLQATSLLGGTEADVAAIFKKVGDLPGGDYGFAERSGKGGLHVAPTQSEPIPYNNGYQIELPDSVMAHMIANPTHNFYFSQWRYLTRIAASTSPDGAKCFAEIQAASEGGFLMLSHTSGQERPTTAVRIGRTILGVGRNIVGHTSFTTAGPYTAGTDPTPDAADYTTGKARSIAQFGAVQRQNLFDPIRAALQSWIFYRFYIEDLTVSGRSYAEVDAINTALWTAATGAGGRFNGDTFTAPA